MTPALAAPLAARARPALHAPPTLPVLLLAALLVHRTGCELTQQVPSFVAEPPALVQYSASRGVRVRCAARGEPTPVLAWITDDGTQLDDRPGLRRVYNNGTLEMLPTSAYMGVGGGNNGAGAGGEGLVSLRCRAANAHGVVLSRDVTLQPVSDVAWEPVVSAAPTSAGGVAALTCGATRHAQYVRVAAWYRADRLLTIDAPAPESRYIMAGNSLLVRGASPADVGAYSCLARHTLSGQTKRSAPATLALSPSGASSAPRVLPAAAELSVPAGADVCLPCVASDHPAPHYSWYREWGGRLQPVEAGGGGAVWWWAEGAALCLRSVTRAAAGAWLCKAYNVFGDSTAHARLHVADVLRVTVAPLVLVADTGSTVRFNCSSSEPGASLSWLHDGAAAGAGAELVLRGVARAHRGAYQCFARLADGAAHADHAAHATAELRLGDSAPELHYTFIEQALRAGGSVSLRCAASGSPAPRFTWLLDDQPLDQYRAQHRYFISQESSANGDVVSVLNMTAAAATDGGRYTCRAHNQLGRAAHSARLNIYGPPSIRALGPVRVVAGANATLYCPYAGYPISSISWWRRGASVALGGTGRVAARGAELRLAPALPADAGHYACAVAAPAGPAARQDIEIQVRNPPKISPFMFSSELTEGSSVQVLCGVSSGDKPMYFSWVKDGAPLPANLQIEEKSLNEFSLLMFSELTARHSGDYTCRVSNHAATVNYTATLSVKVAPAWVTEPLDAAVLLGAPLQLHCAASGHPPPTLVWYRRIGEVSSVGPENGEQWEPVRGPEWGGSAVGAASVGGASVDNSLRASNGTLAAAAASRAHQGLYRCGADNGVGPPLLKHINITVHEPAHFEGSGGNVTCVRGRSAALVCHARGDAPLALHWTHRGTRLDLTSYRWTVSEVRTASGVRSTLQVRAAERADGGEYRCHAHNQFGRSELLLHLHVEEPPEAPRGVRLGGVGARWARVQWRAASAHRRYTALCTALHALPGADPPHTTHNLTLEAPLDAPSDEDGMRTLAARLDGLRPAVAYSLRLAAANHVGQSPHSEPLLFTTLDEPPTGSPQNVRVRPANSGELHVSWSAPPQDTWNGELLGYVASWRELSRFDDDDEEGVSEAEETGEARRTGSATAGGWSSAELTVTGLRPAARYAVTVRAYNRAGAGPPAPPLYATTADGVPELPPRRVTCEGMSARSVRVRWTPPAHAHAHALRGYDLHLLPVHFPASWNGAAEAQVARAGVAGEATLQGLRAATNYSVWVRARADRGLGPPSPPIYCSTLEDAPGAVEAVRALPAGADAVRVTWLAPAHRAGRLTHYTLYIRELGKVGGEWSQRVDVASPDGDDEAWREVRGLREGIVYEFWVRAATAAGAGPPSRPVTAVPAPALAARISSFARVVSAAWGARARLRCAAVGALPLRWRWSPLPRAHTLTDSGDLIIHKVETSSAGNYTCSVRNGAGADAALLALLVHRAPSAPAPRLARAEPHALLLAWDPPPDTGTPLLSYSVRWERAEGGSAGGGAGGMRLLPASDTSLWVRGLACGARYRVTLRAHNALGASPPSLALLAATRGDKAKPPPGKEAVWANSTALRVSLLAWGGRCAVRAWSVALRAAAPAAGAWAAVPADGESAEAGGLRPGAWYEVRVTAHAPAGDTVALYRAATHTQHGERLGEPVEMHTEERRAEAEEAGGGGAGAEFGAGAGGAGAVLPWRAALAPALLAAGLAALLAALAGAVVVRRQQAWCWRRTCSLHRPRHPHPQLYTTEPGKRNGKTLTPPDGEMHEISPYATFSMSGGVADTDGNERTPVGGAGGGGGGGGSGGCALHLRTFGRAEPLDLAAPPPRPNLLSHSAEYGRCRDSDSESSGSPCAACAAELYRLPAAHRADTLPAVESSADDTSYSGGGGGGGGGAARRPARAPRRRGEHISAPTVRYTVSRSARAAAARSERVPM